MYFKQKSSWILLLIFINAGCGSSEEQITQEPKPRPVEVKVLTQGAPPASSLVTAAVASWKTEEIGMEVAGRIEWVAEPNSSIEGQIQDKEGNLILKGDPIARIETKRFELQVQSAQAQVARATQAIASATIELKDSLPAQIKAAKAEERRADINLARSRSLIQKNAGVQSDVDRDEALLSSAEAQVAQLEAAVKGQEAELLSLAAQLEQANDSLEDAQRSLDDCTLHSSFRGQIASVAVVPGSVVSAGQPVATIQMMDPIKVEIEVSAEDSRRLRNRQRLPVLVTREDGSVEEQDGFLYLVDPTADPLTRTFTITLLMLNRRLAGDQEDANLATTDQTWRTDFQFLPGGEDGVLYASGDAILTDSEGSYVWQIDNMNLNSALPADRRLKVSKLRVNPGAAKIPFLGNWIFQQIEVPDESFDPTSVPIAGKLSVPEGAPNEWDGDTILFQNESQWMLRPGDLVRVDLSNNEVQTGIYVPMDAIAYESDRTYVFLLSEGTDSTVERVEVVAGNLTSRVSSALIPIKPVDESVTLTGRRYVSRGAHYLRDGESVRAISAGAAE